MTVRLKVIQVANDITELENVMGRTALYPGYLGPVGTSVWLEPYKLTVPTDPDYHTLRTKFTNQGAVAPTQQTKNAVNQESKVKS